MMNSSAGQKGHSSLFSMQREMQVSFLLLCTHSPQFPPPSRDGSWCTHEPVQRNSFDFYCKKWALPGWGPSSQDNSESTEAQTLFQTWL